MNFPIIYPVACHTDNLGAESTFVAIQGKNHNGIDFIPIALQKGATKIVVARDAIVSEQIFYEINNAGAVLEHVENSRRALAQLSAEALDYPAKKLSILGITGTKGKTTTAFLLEHILQSVGIKTALLSTVYNKIDSEIIPTDLTTKHPDYLHVFFDQCVKAGVEFVVMEVAAQALSLDRVYGIEFDGVIFTNFSLEHSEFYASIDDYFAAKCMLFSQLKEGAPVFLNSDDEWCRKILSSPARILSSIAGTDTAGRSFDTFSLRENTQDARDAVRGERKLEELQSNPYERTYFTFGINTSANIIGRIKNNSSTGLDLEIVSEDESCEVHCPGLLGAFNAYNCVAAAGLAAAMGICLCNAKRALETFLGVPGRLQKYEVAPDIHFFIDYAHNPSSFVAVLSTLRALYKQVIVVFGCGGERDRTKRPLMAKVACDYADRVIITTDNPRGEDPQVIMQDILAGIPNEQYTKVIIELDREQAIHKAYKQAQKNTAIALLGKGPDEYQLINKVKIPFSEKTILQNLKKNFETIV